MIKRETFEEPHIKELQHIFKKKWVYRAGWFKKGRILESIVSIVKL